jgi:hypothetical protein
MTEDQAKARFMQLNLVRLMGLAFVMAGMANVAGKLMPEFTPWLGGILLLNGLFDFFILPNLLRKRWKKADQ